MKPNGYTEKQINRITEDAIEALRISVQKAVGQTDGTFATLYFCDEFIDYIKNYVEDEIKQFEKEQA